MRCEDFPCCGHELGCCPDYDSETGEQLNMVCTCGAKVPLSSNVSICNGCLNSPYDDEGNYVGDDYDDNGYDSGYDD